MKKFILTCLLTLSSAVAFAFSGSGTEADPYLIKTADDLYQIRQNLSAYYQLQNDIDLTEWIADNYPEAGWAPIGSTASPFTGTFDGKNFTISGLYINRTTSNNGLFGAINGGTIKNIRIKCNISGGDYTGGIVGFAYKLTLTCCAVEGVINGSNNTGGLVGKIDQTASDTNGTYYFTNINYCYVEGDITSNGSYVGGLIGDDNSSYSSYYFSYHAFNNCSSKINDCYYKGNITAKGDCIGGICGYATGEYRRCYAKGAIEGKNNTGGIVGYLKGAHYDYGGYVNTTYAIIYSCVNLCSKVKSTSGNVNRICNTGNYTTLGTLGSNTENKVLSDCKVYNGDVLQNVSDSETNGYAIGVSPLMRASTYMAIDWDFTNVWAIDEGKSFPYLRFRKALQAEATTDSEENVTFNFTLPTELTPAVTPSDEEDSGVNITTKTFSNNDVTISFGLGTRTQNFSARLWTNDDLCTGLRVYKDGTMTIATSSDNLITRIALTGDDTSSLTANVGTISGGTWTGEASSVTFTVGASYNKINSIDVTYKHDILALTDVAPAIMKGTYEPGKVKYSRVSGGDYASFCLPFDVDLSEATGIETVYMPMEQIIYNTETEWLMMFLDEQDMTSTVKAGTPFLAKTSGSEVTFSNSKRVSFSQPLSENPVAKTLKVFNFDGHSGVLYKNNTLGVTWGGTYVPTEATEGLNSFNINGSFGQHTGTLNAYRAYVMQTSTAASRVRGIQLNLAGDEGEVTSVFQLLNEPATTEGIYDMTGRRVLNTQQGGLYIINGKKVVK